MILRSSSSTQVQKASNSSHGFFKLTKTGVTVQVRAKRRDASFRPILSPSTTIKWKIIGQKKNVVLIKFGYPLVTSYLCVHRVFPRVSLNTSPASSSSPILSPSLFSPSRSVIFHHFTSVTSRGKSWIVGNLQHHLHGLLRHRPPYLRVNNSSYYNP